MVHWKIVAVLSCSKASATKIAMMNGSKRIQTILKAGILGLKPTGPAPRPNQEKPAGGSLIEGSTITNKQFSAK